MQHELCLRIAHTLAHAPIHDHLGYEALAYLKLPGADYLAVLRALHRTLEPKLYIEIGVRRGTSMKEALPQTRCVGIDPVMSFTDVEGTRPDGNILLASATSDDFFAIEVNRKKCRGFDLALIDGDHSFDQALRDFQNLEALAKHSSIVCLHDVIPMDRRTSQPKPDGVSFHTGDVWRLMARIVRERKDLVAFTVACPPTGLGIVGGFKSGDKIEVPPPWHLRGDENFPELWGDQCRMLNIVPNDPVNILAAFGGRAVESC